MSFPASATEPGIEARVSELVAAGSVEISPREHRAILDNARRRERELRKDIDADRLGRGKLELARERGFDGIERDARMPLRISSKADLAHAAIGEQALFQDLQAVDERTLRARLVAADQEHAMHAVVGRRALEEIAEFVAVKDAARRDVRYRVEARLAHRRDRLESACERQAGKRGYVHARIRGQQRGYLLRAMQVARRDLE